MALLQLPAELRIQILEHMPDFQTSRTETVGPNVRLVPPICRVSRILRQESLPLYAKTSSFIIQTDDNLHTLNNRVAIWLDALDGGPLSKVQSLQLSRHWKIKQPARWQGHVGFYVRLQLVEKQWQCTAGTYPIANDMRGMRLGSVELLRNIVSSTGSLTTGEGLTRADVELIVAAMDVVASHPISPFDIEQSEIGKWRRREVWSQMERSLADTIGTSGQDLIRARLFTPY